MLEGEGQAEWLMSTDFVEKLLMTSETSEAEALWCWTLSHRYLWTVANLEREKKFRPHPGRDRQQDHHVS